MMNISQHCITPLYPLLPGTYGSNGIYKDTANNFTTQALKTYGSNLWFSFRENLNDEVVEQSSRVRLSVYPSIPGQRSFTILTEGAENYVLPVNIGVGDYFALNNYNTGAGDDRDKLFFKTVRDLFVMVPTNSLPVQLNRLSLSNINIDSIDEEEAI